MRLKVRYFSAALAVILLAGCSTMGGPGETQDTGRGSESDLAARAASVLENQMTLSDKNESRRISYLTPGASPYFPGSSRLGSSLVVAGVRGWLAVDNKAAAGTRRPRRSTP